MTGTVPADEGGPQGVAWTSQQAHQPNVPSPTPPLRVDADAAVVAADLVAEVSRAEGVEATKLTATQAANVSDLEPAADLPTAVATVNALLDALKAAGVVAADS